MRRLLLPLLLSITCLGQTPALRDTLSEGKQLWAQQGDREAAFAKVEEVFNALSPRAQELKGEWLRVFCECTNWMAILEDRTPGKRPQALKRLETLLELDPNFDLDRTATNARLQSAFDNLRATRLGRLSLTLEPQGGQLEWDGSPVAGEAFFVQPGSHTLVYRKPGHQPATESVEVSAKETKNLNLTLTRVASTVLVAISPPGAQVALDGKVLGVTVQGSGPETLALSEKLGVPSEQMSADFLVDGLGAGEHILEITAPCHRPKKLRIPAEMTTPLADHALEPVLLARSEGHLTLTSVAPGATAELSGRPLGPLPIKDLVVCSGSYHLKVSYPAGGFTQQIEVADGGAVAVECVPRPRMVSLGLLNSDSFAGRDRVLEQLGAMGAQVSGAAFIPRNPGKEALQDALSRIRLAKEAELVFYLEAKEARPIRLLEAVLTTLDGEEARWEINPLDQDPLGAVVAVLNASPTRAIRDLGLRLIDVPGEKGPWVLEASEAASAMGVQKGKSMTSVAGKPVANVADFHQILDAMTPPLPATLEVLQEGAESLKLPLNLAPIELPLHSDKIAYPLLLVDLQLKRLGAGGDQNGFLAFHEAQVLMHFRRYGKALELLRGVQVEASEGVSQGTMAYYEGLCLLRLGQTFLPDARLAFSRATEHPRSTLFGPDGPLVAPLARQIMDDIKP